MIIALGEGLIGTTAALSAIVGPAGTGWSVEAAVLGLAGVALPFGMWWIYFAVPHGEVLHRRRERSFGWGYGHLVLFGSVVAVGDEQASRVGADVDDGPGRHRPSRSATQRPTGSSPPARYQA